VRKKKGYTRKKSISIFFGIAVALAISVSFGYLLYRDKGNEIEKKITSGKKSIKKHGTLTDTGKGLKPTIKKQKIAIIIDDIGYELSPVDEILRMKAPITLSILPHCPYSKEAAEKAYRAGREILLHLPMEPLGYPDKNPGDGALFVRMGDNEIRHRIEENLKSVPHVSGVNNHMGSRFMSNEEKLEVVLKKLREMDLFFVDSYTTAASIALRLARETGVPAAKRDVFLDPDQSPETVVREFARLKKLAQQNGFALGIGHPYPATLAFLEKELPKLRNEGFELISISELIALTNETQNKNAGHAVAAQAGQ